MWDKKVNCFFDLFLKTDDFFISTCRTFLGCANILLLSVMKSKGLYHNPPAISPGFCPSASPATTGSWFASRQGRTERPRRVDKVLSRAVFYIGNFKSQGAALSYEIHEQQGT
jgi:hypothetical protein